ncbi:DEAD/DEAH box helicase family protein [Marinobacter subterrani]|uniref:DEAD/DEAH box helicase family protein n=1 Tax=Marinobacter subterrani TaxID=1658765 RepID=UPI00235658B6|nr:DEAD/DEAH box helicase [Marinobacter subterrani]
MKKAIRYFAFSLIDSQSADAFVSRQKMQNASAVQLCREQLVTGNIKEQAKSQTWMTPERTSIIPLTEKELARAFANLDHSDWLKIEVLPKVYQRERQFRHSARTHQWAPEYINPVSFQAFVHRSGRIISHGRPRMARECLEPVGQGSIILGKIEDLDSFYEQNPYSEYEHPSQHNEPRISLEETLEYCDRLLAFVCQSNIEEPMQGLRYREVGDPLAILRIEHDASIKTLLATYDALETLDATNAGCFETFVAPIIDGAIPTPRDSQSVRSHCIRWGTLSPEVTLSDDQALAVNAALTMQENEVLAINGPPGTGKTALLKEIVASSLVKSVLANKSTPLIAIASTNNQAIRNAMLSLTKHTPDDSLLHQRWVPEVPGFAVYAVSLFGEEQAVANNLFTMTRLDELEQTLDIGQASVRFCRQANQWLETKTPATTIEDAVEKLRGSLRRQANIQGWVNGWVRQLCAIRSHRAFEKARSDSSRYKRAWMSRKTLSHDLAQCWANMDRELHEMRTAFDQIQELGDLRKTHLGTIENVWASHPLLSRMPWLREHPWAQKLTQSIFRREMLKRGLNPAHITIAGTKRYYDDMHKEREKSVRRVLEKFAQSDVVAKWLTQMETELSRQWRSDWFWLALHVREGEWLMSVEKTLRAQDPDKRTQDKVIRRLQRQACIAPVLVGTLHRLPKVLTYWDIGQQSELPLLNILDMLIVDEAGQCSPDVAAASMALTKRAVLIGDREQLAPVWSLSEREDIGNRIASGLLTKQQTQGFKGEQFNISGGTTSGGSALWLAQRVTAVSENNKLGGGLWLKNNRRSVPAIVKLSNQLSYEGSLIAGRDDVSKSPYPAISMLDIPGRCDSLAGSRGNTMEAMMVANWVAHEKSRIEAIYERPLAECLAVITPFKAQADLIQSRLTRQMGAQDAVSVGTIHSLQGAERPIIILSLTYSAEGHPQSMFFDQSSMMLNVAASRAEDSLIVMGDLDTLSRAKRAGKVLGEYLQETAKSLQWTPWHPDMLAHAPAIWGDDAIVNLVQSPEENALLMALSDESITAITISTSELEPKPLQNFGNAMIRAARRGCKITLIMGQKTALGHPEASRIGRGLDALQANGVEVRYMPLVLGNRVCLSNGMTLITPTSWLADELPQQILLVQNDPKVEWERMERAYQIQ